MAILTVKDSVPVSQTLRPVPYFAAKFVAGKRYPPAVRRPLGMFAGTSRARASGCNDFAAVLESDGNSALCSGVE
jgi:hypothetical protein